MESACWLLNGQHYFAEGFALAPQPLKLCFLFIRKSMCTTASHFLPLPNQRAGSVRCIERLSAPLFLTNANTRSSVTARAADQTTWRGASSRRSYRSKNQQYLLLTELNSFANGLPAK
jgi:hypothetical protein